MKYKKLAIFLNVLLLVTLFSSLIYTTINSVRNTDELLTIIENQTIQIDSLNYNLQKAKRVSVSQRYFFERVINGKYQYIPALDACRMALIGHTKYETAYLHDSVLNRVNDIDLKMSKRMIAYGIEADKEIK